MSTPCRHTHVQTLPAFLAGALLSVWLMFGLCGEARAQAAPGTAASVIVPGSEPSGLGALDATLEQRLQVLAMAGARQVAPTQARVEVELGRLDPRLRLAPCGQIQPYLPPGQKMWGRTRLGLRCLAGVTKWNVTLPLTIRVYGQAYVAASDLPAGTLLTQDHLRLAEVDIAGEAGAIYTQPDAWVGRHLARPVTVGDALRSSDLKLRQWVQPGDRVQVLATGTGYAVAGEGQAMGVGLEGQDVRVRFDNGRMVTGRTIGERRVEVLL
ncbi:flagella basal body P-ring formation protein FlgA [Roseateles aquatilis]|uniref:Flagella basal body P-ring formation protein FlgA n=1 Tax=Roseateles aquatilis TaxID=431061 RepID=A0A246JFN3_9BURK|nr:flagellar basal body P-ring formation chaperone FlgA [Roseateles aquatilis]OWQ91330.1 flagella basal body P-ring formation protein FlgA [Roseateles aquatilis]